MKNKLQFWYFKLSVMKKAGILFLSLICILTTGYTQIITNEHPFSIQNKEIIDIPEIVLPQFDLKQELLNDSIFYSKNGNKLFKFAKVFDAQFHSATDGIWQSLPDGGKLWLLRIASKGAYSINFTFSHFAIPEGAKLWVYNSNKNAFLGAITSVQNREDEILAISPVPGEKITIEYYQPANSDFDAWFSISTVGHDYTNALFAGEKDGQYGQSGNCNVDIQCTAGNNWQVQKKAVARIIVNNSLLGTGTLVNNTFQNAIPYLLTANHVIRYQSSASNSVFFFNYESPSCNGPDGYINQSISGCTLLSTKYDSNGKLDFSLVQLSVNVPLSYNPYFSGWNRSNSPSGPYTCIHHPSGDVKKISGSGSTLVTEGFMEFDNGSCWKVADWSSGTTEGGSSGSGLFDANQLLVGNLSGGEATCSYPHNDYYQKFNLAWNKYPSNDQQLAYWLDPEQSSPSFLEGFFPNSSTGGWTDLETLSNFDENTTLSLYLADAGGYLAGNNAYHDRAKAEYFDQSDYGTLTHLKGIYFSFGKARGNSNLDISCALWKNSGGVPGAQFATATTKLGTIINNVLNETFTLVEFSSPIPIPGSFYAGVFLPQTAGDTIALITNSENQSTINTAWELNAASTWLPYSSNDSWGVNLANGIFPVVGRYTSIFPTMVTKKDLIIFPNPANTTFKIQYEPVLENNLQLKIFNTSGRLLMAKNIASNQELIDVSHLETGIYIVEIKTNKHFFKNKLIKVPQ